MSRINKSRKAGEWTCRTPVFPNAPFLDPSLCTQTASPQDVTAGSSSRGGDVRVYEFDINQPTLPTPFYSVLVSISVFMALSTVFRSIYFCLIGPFNYLYLYESPSGLIVILCG